MLKKKYYPCWVCKGQGGWKEPILDDGSGPYDKCGYCEGEGLIEIGGPIQRRHKRESIAMELIGFVKPNKSEWTYQEMQDIGEKALQLLEKDNH